MPNATTVYGIRFIFLMPNMNLFFIFKTSFLNFSSFLNKKQTGANTNTKMTIQTNVYGNAMVFTAAICIPDISFVKNERYILNCQPVGNFLIIPFSVYPNR